MQSCPSALRRKLCRALYHDIDIVSCHPTLMLQVVRKMVVAGALQWRDELNKLVEYAELDTTGVPVGRMPLLLRVAEHFGAQCHLAWAGGVRITHVVAGKPDTASVERALRTPGVFAVGPQWLVDSAQRWCRPVI